MSRSIPAENGQAWRITAEVEAAKKLAAMKLPVVDTRVARPPSAEGWPNRFSN